MAHRFKGGIKIAHHKKQTEKKSIEALPLPELLIVPVQQHLGGPAKPTLKRGDTVLKGQQLAEPTGFVSVGVHAPSSGKIKAIEQRPHPTIGKCMSFVIETDGEDKWIEGIKGSAEMETATADQIRNAVREAGVVGMGGAAFPTHVKLNPPEDKPIDTVLINGAECEPFLTSDHAAMRESAEAMIDGTKLCMRAAGAKKAVIGIEENKPDVIKLVGELCSASPDIDVEELPTLYPQGAERSLIHAILDRELPAGKLPMEVGVVVQNANTAIAVADAVLRGLPVIEKIVTVTGSCVVQPKNVRAPIGAPLSNLIEFCGGFNEEPAKILMGGPMMGIAQYTLDVPVIKASSGIVCLTAEESPKLDVQPCIRCGRCVEACPMRLVPTEIDELVKNGEFAEAQEAGALDCVECGCCTYACPSHRPLVQTIRTAKAVIREIEQKRRQKNS